MTGVRDSSVPLEVACSFGDSVVLAGVYTPATASGESAPCVLYLTAGLLHHVGPSRLHVEMARAAASRGCAGLRFDLSGAGDSETSSEGGYFTERSVAEIQQAMDYLQHEHGHQRFILMGLCSGADDALATSLVDNRVVGLVMLNGYAYRTLRFHWHRVLSFYAPRVLKPRKIVNGVVRVTRRVVGRVLGRDIKRSQGSATRADISTEDAVALRALDDDYRYIPPRETTEKNLGTLAARGTRMLWVYTGSEHEDYTYQGQFFAMFPSLKGEPCVTECYLKKADHTYILQEDRQVLIEHTLRWLEQKDFR